MRKLAIPERLKPEFATVETIWHSGAETRRVDALILAWVKYEKQLRRLFCFLVFQHPEINEATLGDLISVIVQNRNLYPATFMKGIEGLGVQSVRQLLHGDYDRLQADIDRISKYRNKMVHGQISGARIHSPQLEKDVLLVVEWVGRLAEAAHNAFGYDGLERNTFRVAKRQAMIDTARYPFSSAEECKRWISRLQGA